MTEIDNIQTVVDTAIATTKPTELQPGAVYGWALPNGSVHRIDLTGDEYRDQPRRKSGTTYVDDLNSFLEYWGKHSDGASELYVNVKEHFITGVLDAHTGDDARWGQHRVVLRMETSDRWKDWTRQNRKGMTQHQWADFLEDHVEDVRTPDAATMLEIANTFHASTKIKFQSSISLTSGSQRLTWEEQTTGTAGNTGQLEVPKTFTIGVAPFDFADAFGLTARFRYRISNGSLEVCFVLDDPAAVIRDAVLDVVKKLEEALTPTGEDAKPSHKVMRGAPA